MYEDICFKIGTSSLFVDEYLVDFDIPIFYICKTEFGKKYSVVCVDSHNMEYIISSTTNEDILKMLKSQLLLRDFILKSDEHWHILSGDTIDDDKINRIYDIPDNMLPKSGEYLDLHNKRIDDYSKKIQNEIDSANYLNSFDNHFSDLFEQNIITYFDYSHTSLLLDVPVKMTTLHRDYYSRKINLTKKGVVICR